MNDAVGEEAVINAELGADADKEIVDKEEGVDADGELVPEPDEAYGVAGAAETRTARGEVALIVGPMAQML